MDAGGAPQCGALGLPRAPVPGDYNLVATVTIGPQPV
jgi:hypothetical protein